MEDIETNCFYIVLVDDVCDDNIEDCLNSDNQLRYAESHMRSMECYLVYTETDGKGHIALSGDVTFTLGATNFAMKGAFLTNDAGYVMGYSINTSSLNITNALIFEEGLRFWDIYEGVSNGE